MVAKEKKLWHLMIVLVPIVLLIIVYKMSFAIEKSAPIFTPANVVSLHVDYHYSNTGGLAGIDAADPSDMEALFTQQPDGTYDFEFNLYNEIGFSSLLDPLPLREFVVNPPTGNETQEELLKMMDRGDFDGDVKNKKIYYYQEVNGLNSIPDYTLENPTYQNRYSDIYNKAWNNARKLITDDYTLLEYCSDTESELHQTLAEDNHGANRLTKPKIRITLTQAQMEKAMTNGLSISVTYRRNATWYTVKHWVPEELCGLNDQELADKKADANNVKTVGSITYILMDIERKQGRAGAMTKATAMVGDLYDLLVPETFMQDIVLDAGDPSNHGGTVMDIFYKAADSYRVIFNTDQTYIPRQKIPLGNKVDFSTVPNPARQGYTFAGWQYLKKDATKDENGKYTAEDYIPIPTNADGQYDLTITGDLITQEAMVDDVVGLPVLNLYPIWVPANTKITVVFWTENLTWADDVYAKAEGGNTEYYDNKYRDYSELPVTHYPTLYTQDSNYSNMGSFVIDNITTDSTLVSGDSLISAVQTQITNRFHTEMGTARSLNNADFYTQAGFEIVHDSYGQTDKVTTAYADGHTRINVYYTRNVYTLKLHYFGTVSNWSNPYYENGDETTPELNQGDYQAVIANNTNGYSYEGVDKILDSDGELIFNYRWGANSFLRHANNKNFPETDMPVPKTITIKAKYGADLRQVWPSARPEEQIGNMKPLYSSYTDDAWMTAKMISWATTEGKYRDDAVTGAAHANEPTIMGLYASMDSEIVAEAADQNNVHHLVAYWYEHSISYYRYNHCFELPGIKSDTEGMKTISIYNNSTEIKDTLYLIPADLPSITKYGFTDIMKVNYDPATNEIEYDAGIHGQYYVARCYNNKFYALGRRVDATSSNYIMAQNPSPRQHTTKVNQIADHSSQHQDVDGRTYYIGGDVPVMSVGSAGNPYDLYFYYDRDRYTIKYMVPTTNASYGKSEIKLGEINLPFGTYVTQANYAFHLDYRDTNQTNKEDGTHKYLWSYPSDATDPIPVCPDRNPAGKAVWTFKGWALGVTGLNMQWQMPDEYLPQAQIEQDFYIDSDLILYAIWTPPQLSVTFHLNGGAVSDRESLVVSVPANTVYTTVGVIPRPFRNGYDMLGWYEANEKGQPIDADGNPTKDVTKMQVFSFDSVIIDHKNLVAIWKANYSTTYDYTVYHVTKELYEPGSISETIQLDATGNVVETGGTTYYVLNTEVHRDQLFFGNHAISESIINIPNYTGVRVNGSLDITEARDDYKLALIYTPQYAFHHKVQYVLAGTENNTSPRVIHARDVVTDLIYATPKIIDLQSEDLRGYELVNRTGIGENATYTKQDTYETLKWMTPDGEFKNMIPALTYHDIPDVVTYLVQPITYSITYKNADDSPTEPLTHLQASLNAVITKADGDGLNPVKYTQIHEAINIKNPEDVVDIANNKTYIFRGWTIGETGTPNKNLVIDAETTGDLVLVAHWKVLAEGNLKVTNTVEGELGNKEKAFNFRVELSDTTITGTYGDMEFNAGIATFTLKHGEEKNAINIPNSVTYTVTQSEEANYTTTKTGDTGEIITAGTSTAKFVNSRYGGVDTDVFDGMTPISVIAGVILLWLVFGIYSLFKLRKRKDMS